MQTPNRCACVHPLMHRDENGHAYCSRCALPLSIFRVQTEGLEPSPLFAPMVKPDLDEYAGFVR